METSQTPILTKQQQKRTLSGKKKLQGRSLFASPYDTYWPELDKNAEKDFNELLLSALKLVGKPKVRVQWSELRKVPRDQRKEVRRKLEMESVMNTSQDEEQKSRESLCLGVNAVTRGLNSSVVSSVLLAKDADPKLLISHIITMCSMKAVPILLVPALRHITKQALGFSCIALAIKNKSVEDFEELHNTVKSLCAEIPVPEPLISYQHQSVSEQEEEEEEEAKHHSLQNKDINISADVYKYRSSKKERVFVPDIVPIPKPSTDFLALDMEEPKNTSPKFVYRPVRIKTLPLNSEKIRRKELKKRKK